MLRTLAILAALLAAPTAASAQSWTARSAPPVPVGPESVVAVEGGRWYVVVGDLSGTFMAYDAPSDSWFTFAPLPVGAGLGASVAGAGDGDTVYVAPGNGSDKVYGYSISLNAWTLHSTLPFVPAVGTCLFATGGELHALEGLGSNHWEYKPATTSWVSAALVPFVCTPGTKAMQRDASSAVAVAPGSATLWYYFQPTDSWTPGVPLLDVYTADGGFARIPGGYVVEIPSASVRVRVYEESSATWQDRFDPINMVVFPMYLPEADPLLRLTTPGLEQYVPAAPPPPPPPPPPAAGCDCDDETKLGGGCSAGPTSGNVLALALGLGLLAYFRARRTLS